MIVSRIFAAFALSVGMTGCADRVVQLCRADINERLIRPDTVRFHEFSTLTYEQRIAEMVEASLNAPTPIPIELRAAYRSDFERRARRMSAAWAKLEMSFHRYRITAQGRSGRDVTTTLGCGSGRDMCRCSNALADRELYKS